MPKTKPVVVVTRKLPDPIETRMMELFDTRLNRDDKPMSQSELTEAVKTADVLVPTVTDHIDKTILAQAGDQLKLIASFGTGVDHIDLATARQRNVTVTNTPGVLTEDTADMTMALILAVPRRLAEGERLMRVGRLDRMGADIDARGTASGASAWGSSAWAASVPRWRAGRAASACRSIITIGVAFTRNSRTELEATYWESLDQMLAHMDIVSVNCPHTPATYHLLSARRLKLLKDAPPISSTPRAAR